MIYRLMQLYEALGPRDLVQIAILAVVIYGVLHFVGRTCGAGSSISRGLGIVVVGLFLLAQVVIASFDLVVLGRVLDYLLTTVLVGLLVIFQPELRRGLVRQGAQLLAQDRPAHGRRREGRQLAREGHGVHRLIVAARSDGVDAPRWLDRALRDNDENGGL